MAFKFTIPFLACILLLVSVVSAHEGHDHMEGMAPMAMNAPPPPPPSAAVLGSSPSVVVGLIAVAVSFFAVIGKRIWNSFINSIFLFLICFVSRYFLFLFIGVLCVFLWLYFRSPIWWCRIKSDDYICYFDINLWVRSHLQNLQIRMFNNYIYPTC